MDGINGIHFGTDGILTIALGALWWFITRAINSSNSMHKDHYAATKKLQEWFAGKFDELQDKISEKFDELQSKILSNDEILGVVNGKYISRREIEIMIEQREQWRSALLHRLAVAEKEIERLRKS